MKLSDITPLILTWNEEPNIGRCLDRLKWADRVVVLDSGSTDRTEAICSEFQNVDFIHRDFDCHTSQWNYGIEKTRSPWILGLDADFMTSTDLPQELQNLSPESGLKGYQSSFTYSVLGESLRSSLYPPKTVLFDRSCRFVQDGHTQLLTGDDPCGKLKSVINHDDRKSLSRWLSSQQNYVALEAEKLAHASWSEVGLADKLRLMIWPAAPITLIYLLFWKLAILDGWKGTYYAFQRCYAELLLSLELLDQKIRLNNS